MRSTLFTWQKEKPKVDVMKLFTKAKEDYDKVLFHVLFLLADISSLHFE